MISGVAGGTNKAKEIVVPQRGNHVFGGQVILRSFFGPNNYQGCHCEKAAPDRLAGIQVYPFSRFGFVFHSSCFSKRSDKNKGRAIPIAFAKANKAIAPVLNY